MSAKVIVGAIAFLAASVVAYQVVTSMTKPKPVKVVDATPPVDAKYLEDGPLAIMGAINSVRKGVREQAKDEFIGSWVPDPGWEGPVQEITDETEGETLRIYALNSGVIGGGYWILAVVGPGHGVTKGQLVDVAGRLDDVRTQTVAGVVTHSFVLKPARVVARK